VSSLSLLRFGRAVGGRRAALWLLVFSSAVAFFNAGMTWMTHMHHEGLRHVEPGRMAAYDLSYEQLTSVTVVPLNALSILCVVAMLLLRPRGVPWWLIGAAAAVQATVWVVRTTLWGPLADDTRNAGWVMRDGLLEPSYAQYMSTNWIRIALLSGYAVLVFVMLVAALGKSSSEKL
jgi:hypothetical protein